MPVRQWLLSPWLTVRVQIALGVIFVAAALPKIVDPPSFAHMLYNYRLIPGPAVNLLSLTLPWLELLCGLALILGIWRRSATVIIGALLVVFIVSIGINLTRDNAVNCGCFDTSSANKSHDELIDEMWVVVIRDLGMLLMVAQILAASRSESDSHRGTLQAPGTS